MKKNKIDKLIEKIYKINLLNSFKELKLYEIMFLEYYNFYIDFLKNNEKLLFYFIKNNNYNTIVKYLESSIKMGWQDILKNNDVLKKGIKNKRFNEIKETCQVEGLKQAIDFFKNYLELHGIDINKIIKQEKNKKKLTKHKLSNYISIIKKE